MKSSTLKLGLIGTVAMLLTACGGSNTEFASSGLNADINEELGLSQEDLGSQDANALEAAKKKADEEEKENLTKVYNTTLDQVTYVVRGPLSKGQQSIEVIDVLLHESLYKSSVKGLIKKNWVTARVDTAACKAYGMEIPLELQKAIAVELAESQKVKGKNVASQGTYAYELINHYNLRSEKIQSSEYFLAADGSNTSMVFIKNPQKIRQLLESIEASALKQKLCNIAPVKPPEKKK